jgi:hypothetical protein
MMLSAEGRFLARASHEGLFDLAIGLFHTIGCVARLARALTYTKIQVGKVAHRIPRIEVFSPSISVACQFSLVWRLASNFRALYFRNPRARSDKGGADDQTLTCAGMRVACLNLSPCGVLPFASWGSIRGTSKTCVHRQALILCRPR